MKTRPVGLCGLHRSTAPRTGGERGVDDVEIEGVSIAFPNHRRRDRGTTGQLDHFEERRVGRGWDHNAVPRRDEHVERGGDPAEHVGHREDASGRHDPPVLAREERRARLGQRTEVRFEVSEVFAIDRVEHGRAHHGRNIEVHFGNPRREHVRAVEGPLDGSAPPETLDVDVVEERGHSEIMAHVNS